MSAALPDPLAERELAAVKRRRHDLGQPEGDPPRDGVGLALSGGGIRSATFSIGVLQGLAARGLLDKVDFLSTVSGGGYCGSFLGRLFMRKPEESAKERAAEVQRELAGTESAAIRWLRDCGRYLSPAGTSDARLALAVVLRSWLSLMWVVALFLFMFFSFGGALRQLLWQTTPWATFEGWLITHAGHPIWWSPLLLISLVPLLLGAIPLGWAFWFTQRGERRWSGMTFVASLLAVLASIGVAVAPDMPPPLLDGARFVALTGSLAIIYWIIASPGSPNDPEVVAKARNRLTRALSGSMLIAGVTLAAGIVDSLGQTVYALLQTTAVTSTGERILSPTTVGSLLASLAPLVAAGRYVVGKLNPGTGGGGDKSATSMRVVAIVAAALITLIGLTALDVGSHAILWSGATPGAPAEMDAVTRSQLDPGFAFADVHCTPPPSASQSPSIPPIQGNNAATTQLPPPPAPALPPAPPPMQPSASIWIAFGVAALFSAMIGRSFAFLNLSGYQGLYAARLTRAYLGASNPARTGPAGVRVTETIDGDDLPFTEYRPHERGGPLHFVNVTLNETVDGKSEIEQRDRKGMAMALGPFGVSVGVRHHALWPAQPPPPSAHGVELDPIPLPRGDFAVFPMKDPKARWPREFEALGLGGWMGISGAAFSTGLGSRTSLVYSLLAGVANVRLGYWFDSGIRPRDRSGVERRSGVLARVLAGATEVFPVQIQLLEEFLARFHGPARRRWYLTDGGHFENTACYELIRRRVPFILCCDDGADPDYSFADGGALVRLARTDLGAEIEIVKPETPGDSQTAIGALADLVRGRSNAHAVLAKVRYLDGKSPDSHILFLKPSVTGDEPLDVLEYQHSHADFPQEPTADQYFDEAQWESYRILGLHVAKRVFDSLKQGATWLPKQFKQA